MCRSFRDAAWVDADDDRVGVRRPIHRRAFGARVFNPVRPRDCDGKFARREKVRRVGIALLGLRILRGESFHIVAPGFIA